MHSCTPETQALRAAKLSPPRLHNLRRHLRVMRDRLVQLPLRNQLLLLHRHEGCLVHALDVGAARGRDRDGRVGRGRGSDGSNEVASPGVETETLATK